MKLYAKRGSMLAFAIIILAVLSVLGVTVLVMATNDTNQVMRQQKRIQSFYIARSGADFIASHLIKNPLDAGLLIADTQATPATGTINGQDFEVRLTGTYRDFLIESVAYRDGEEDARIYLSMKEFNLFDYSIFADEILTVGNNLSVYGDIGTNQNDINFGLQLIDGTVTLGPEASPESIAEAKSMTVGNLDPNVLNTELSLPTGYTAPFDAIEFTTDANGVYTVSGEVACWIDYINLQGNDKILTQLSHSKI